MPNPTVAKPHPLAELLACKLFGLKMVPSLEQGKMIQRAADAIVDWHKAEIEPLLELQAAVLPIVEAARAAKTNFDCLSIAHTYLQQEAQIEAALGGEGNDGTD